MFLNINSYISELSLFREKTRWLHSSLIFAHFCVNLIRFIDLLPDGIEVHLPQHGPVV